MKKQISNTWELKKNLGMVEILLNKIKGKKKVHHRQRGLKETALWTGATILVLPRFAINLEQITLGDSVSIGGKIWRSLKKYLITSNHRYKITHYYIKIQ